MDDIAYLYLDLLEHLEVSDAIVVGASIGSWIALEMGVRNTNRIAKLVLVSPVGVKFSGREERDFADIFYLPDSESLPLLFAAPERWAPDYAALSESRAEGLARERQALAHYAWKPYLHNPGLKPWLHRIDVDTLVLCGEADHFAMPGYGARVAESLPRASLQVVPGAAHYPQIEQAAAVVEAVARFR